MEQHFRLQALVLRVVLLAALTVAALPLSYATGTCILPTNQCQNDTFDTSTLAGSYGVTIATCHAAGGTWDPRDDLFSVQQCQIGCCCGAGTPSPQTIALACQPTTTFVPTTSDPTCQTTCSGTTLPPPACLEGAITQGDIDARCVCGTASPSTVGEYCCWDGTLTSSAAQCPVPSIPCSRDVLVAEWCSCSGQTINDRVCCSSGAVVDSPAQCEEGSVQIGVCGNFIKEQTEQCDARYVWDTNQQKFVFSSGAPCLSSTAYCSTQCNCMENTLTGCNGVCDPNENTAACPNDCPAPPTCNAGTGGFPPPISLSGSFNSAQPNANLTWQANPQCTSGLLGYIVQRSATSTQAARNSPDYVSPQLPRSARSFTDDLPPDIADSATSLYYAVGAIYRTASGATGVGFDTITIAIPNALCPQPSSAYCIDANTAVNCQNHQPVQTNCTTSGTTCQVQGSEALCIKQAPCEKCNGVHQMFGFPSEPLSEFRPDGSVTSTTCGASMTCYRDLRQTSAELFLMCSQINSCTGYRTKAACDANMCTRPGGDSPSDSCEWIATSVDLNSGVCRPVDPAFQDCKSCSDLGSACTQTTCEAISSQDPSACYYHVPGIQLYSPDTSTSPVCLPKKEVPCEFLQSQQACEGGSTYELNLTYGSSTKLRTAGDHTAVTLSNDVLEHGKCTWFLDEAWPQGGYCAKDSDDSEEADDKEILFSISRANVLYDFDAPITTIAAIPSAYYPRHFSVQVLNESPFVYNICPASQANCYPTLATSAGIAGGSVRKTFQTSESGQYIMHYYAEDVARNIEEVKKFPFLIDGTPPVITVDQKTLTPYSANPTTILTSVYISFSASEPASCTTKLLNGTNLAPVSYFIRGVAELGDPPATQPPFGQRFSITYPQLPDGQYFLNVTCTDQNGNINPEGVPPIPEPIVVDSDPTIHSPSPVSATPTNDASVTISIQTNSSANCRYTQSSATIPSFASMTPYDTTGGQVHEADVPVTTGNYSFVTACDINNVIVRGGSADTISFLIDRIPPTTQVCNRQATGNSSNCVQIVVGPSNKQESYALTLRCTDTGAVKSGCDFRDDIYSCTYPQGGQACDPSLYPGEPDIQTITGTGVTHVRYFAVDKAGNREAVHDDIFHAYDLTPPSAPTFSVSP